MQTYLVLLPQDGEPGDDRALFLRDSFSAIAFLLPVVWFLWHRMWFWALAYLLVLVGCNLLIGDPRWWPLGAALGFAASLLAGLEARAMRIAARERAGWRVDDIILASDLTEAEDAYFMASERRVEAAPPPRNGGAVAGAEGTA